MAKLQPADGIPLLVQRRGVQGDRHYVGDDQQEVAADSRLGGQTDLWKKVVFIFYI